MNLQTPTRRAHGAASPNTQLKTPVAQVLHNVERLTPQSNSTPGDSASPFASPALLRMDEAALRTRLREAYGLLKEKEKNLFMAATVGQDLVEANQQLQDGYEAVERELAATQQKLKQLSEAPLQSERISDDDEQALRLHGRRRSMHIQHASEKCTQPPDSGAPSEIAETTNNSEKQWIKTHVQPVKAQLLLAQEHTDELLVEREELGTQVFQLRQELSAALRRAGESSATATEAHKHLGQLEEDNARLHDEIDKQRTFWAKRWAEHQRECKTGQLVNVDDHQGADNHAEDVAARLHAELKADELQMQHSAMQAENEVLRGRIERIDEERTEEWEPMRARWLSCEEALQELQETHQSTCEALAQAEARLAELDKSAQLEDPIKLKSQKTSTSLLGELDLQRHNAVSQQRMLAREHAALKRAYGRAINSQSRMKQQVARLTQLAASGASEARMKRLEAALGEAECQQQALLWASMEQRRPVAMDADVVLESSDYNGTTLITALRARLKQAFVDRDQAQRELRTTNLLRANEIQRTRDLEREAADAEAKLCQVVGELTSLRADHESLRRAARASKRYHPKPNSKNKKPSGPSSIKDDNSSCGVEDCVLPRKRTRSGAQPIKDGLQRKLSGPMSVSFVINTDTAALGETKPPSSPSGSHDSTAQLQSSTKRPRFQTAFNKEGIDALKSLETSNIDNDNGGMGISKGLTISPSRTKSSSQVNDAADRGMRSWLDTLGADAATSLVQSAADTASAMTENDGVSTAIGSDNVCDRGKSSSINASQDQKSTTVDEIHISSRIAQKPMECNNQ
ncbi:hypothetical protein COEREDRAFT_13699 [Coemansia reversa NRRL 1564]|uniref:Uncharacterized protein n=1 Tax=Coemansia reversa (strain ATCC 12441 / NRRL 1564) TaxID=763665 RepID=A0A2G5BI27_COERN|nr:hypothetical protein COEREDRAFT_13699 [Coemansia reversa NRRL 1564]|eukprot:PIA18631.1 hypothetical protein COEREDRAFT_13699 [Coemansia reversa NRRL 1564]